MFDAIIGFIDDHPILSWGSLIVLVAVLGLWASFHEENVWQQYAAQHHCEVKGTRAGQTAVGPSTGEDGGFAIVQEPDQTIYVCDGGEIVIR